MLNFHIFQQKKTVSKNNTALQTAYNTQSCIDSFTYCRTCGTRMVTLGELIYRQI